MIMSRSFCVFLLLYLIPIEVKAEQTAAQSTEIQSTCVSIVLAPNTSVVRLFNDCERQKIASINWSDGKLQEVLVNPHSFVDIPNRAQVAQLVGERDISNAQNCDVSHVGLVPDGGHVCYRIGPDVDAYGVGVCKDGKMGISGNPVQRGDVACENRYWPR